MKDITGSPIMKIMTFIRKKDGSRLIKVKTEEVFDPNLQEEFFHEMFEVINNLDNAIDEQLKTLEGKIKQIESDEDEGDK